MSKQLTQSGQQAPAQPPAKQNVKSLFSNDHVRAKFQELLGKRSSAFLTSVLQAVSSNDLLQKVDPMSIYHAATIAATLDLPVNQNLGFSYLIPYKDKCQFQLGWRGLVQLALRSGQFNRISTTEIYEGQVKEENPLTGYVFDFTAKRSDKIIGYAAYFRLINGFEATYYMTVDQVLAHAKRFSQTFKKGYGLWVDDRDSMAKKTVLKLLLSKYAPLSIEMQKAVIADQGVINDEDATDVTYVDNTAEPVDKALERAEFMLRDAQSLDQLQSVWDQFSDEIKTQLGEVMEERYNELDV